MNIDSHRFFSFKRSCSHIAVACLAALVLSLTGCTKSRKEPYLVLENASIVSPEGRIELEAATKRSKGRTPKWSLGMWAPERLLSFHPLAGPFAMMYVVRPIGPSGPNFEVVEILYQLNDGNEIVLEPLRIQEDQGSSRRNQAVLQFIGPDNLANLIDRAPGGMAGTIERINDQNGDIHRFYIEFIINDEPHVLDASFQIKLDPVWYGGGSFGGLP